jgi:hypothetical protein
MDALSSAAYFFTLTVAELDSSLSDDPAGLYDRAVMTALFAAVARTFSGPVYAVAEVGKGSAAGRRGRLHCHIVAHRDDGPAQLDRDTARCQPVYDVFGLYKYLAKCPEPRSLAAELDAAAGRVMSPSGRLPNTRRHFLSPARLAWSRSLIALEPNTLIALEPNTPESLNPEPSEPRHAERPGPDDRSLDISLEGPQTTAQAPAATPQLRPATGTRPARRRPGSSYPMRRAVPTVDARARAPPRTAFQLDGDTRNQSKN